MSGAPICSRLVRLALGGPEAQMRARESTCSRQSSTGQEPYQVWTCLVVCWWGQAGGSWPGWGGARGVVGFRDGAIVGFVVWVWVRARAQPNDDVDEIVGFIVVNGLGVTGAVCTWE